MAFATASAELLAPTPLLIAHAAATCAMAGLVWFVQIVHYPLFAAVDSRAFATYERLHTRLTSRVVAPTMLVELVTAVAIAAIISATSLPWVGLFLLLVIWAATFFLQVPRHRELSRGFQALAHRRLVASNWIRTIAWSGRAVIALILLADH